MSKKIGILCAIILFTATENASDAAAEPSVQYADDEVSIAALTMHDRCVQHPNEDSVACVRHNHTMLDACDRDSDGHRVRAHFIDCVSGLSYHGSWDPNGANPGCAHDWVFPICWMRVCVEDEGCSDWVPT